MNTYSELAGIMAQIKTQKRERGTDGSSAGGKDLSGFQGAREEEVTTAMGGSHWKHPETVGFPSAPSTHVIGEHFLSPWLQETGQGCLFFFFFPGLKAWGRWARPNM